MTVGLGRRRVQELTRLREAAVQDRPQRIPYSWPQLGLRCCDHVRDGSNDPNVIAMPRLEVMQPEERQRLEAERAEEGTSCRLARGGVDLCVDEVDVAGVERLQRLHEHQSRQPTATMIVMDADGLDDDSTRVPCCRHVLRRGHETDWQLKLLIDDTQAVHVWRQRPRETIRLIVGPPNRCEQHRL